MLIANKCDDDYGDTYNIAHSSDMAPCHLRSGGTYTVVMYVKVVSSLVKQWYSIIRRCLAV